MEVDVLDDLDPRTQALQSFTGMVENHSVTLSRSPKTSFGSLNVSRREKKRLYDEDEDDEDYYDGDKKRPVVVLDRLPERTTRALQPQILEDFEIVTVSPDSVGSGTMWEPQDESENSNNSYSNDKKLLSESENFVSASIPSPAGCSSDNTEQAPIESATFSQLPAEPTKQNPEIPNVELKEDMVVLARKRAMRWQRGKIVELVIRDDGRIKYKVCFVEKGKSLVSGHHLAFENTPKLDQLSVGARVVIQSPEDKLCFMPGILAELPSRKNRLRFLVFLDDHTPLYVGLPSLHLVCKPLEDTLEDLPDSNHKHFMRQYLKNWPYPHLTHYKVDQSIRVELNGQQQKCKVQVVDCSLIHVIFETNQSKEWIHRGSLRLEHMAKFMKKK